MQIIEWLLPFGITIFGRTVASKSRYHDPGHRRHRTDHCPMPLMMAKAGQMENAMNFPTTLDEIRVDYPEAPPNVPKDRIVDISFAMGGVPNDLVDPYEKFEWLNGQNIPRLLYNKPTMSAMGAAAAGGGGMSGNWVATHYEDIDRIYC